MSWEASKLLLVGPRIIDPLAIRLSPYFGTSTCLRYNEQSMNTTIQQELRPRSRRWLAALAVVGSLSIFAGCAHKSASSSVYTYGQAQREQIVRLGTVEGV